MPVRRVRALARATAIEILGEPLCLLILISSLALAILAPAIHYHQFGEPSRMARDAAFSALLLGGFCHAAFAAHKTIRREVESGTMESALAHSLSRTRFFLAKTLGTFAAYLLFALTVMAVALTMVNGAEIGGRLSASCGDLARVWGPSLACALAALVLPLVAAALLNRFARTRFTLSANLLMLLIALAGAAYRFDAHLAARILPAAILFALPPVVLLAASAAFAMRFRSNIAATLTVLAALALLPLTGNYCLSDALSKGGSVPAPYFFFALAAIIPAIAVFLMIGGGND